MISKNIHPILLNCTYAFLIIMLSVHILECSTYCTRFSTKTFDLLLMSSRFFMVFFFLFEEYIHGFDIKRLCYFFVFMSLSVLFVLLNSTWNLFDFFFVPLFLSNLFSYKTVINIVFYTFVISVLCVIVLFALKLIPAANYHRGFILRRSLGFGHPNALGLMVMMISMVLVLKTQSITFGIKCILLFFSLFCLAIPNSYASGLFLLFILVLMHFIEKFEGILRRNSVKLFCLFLFFMFITISFVYFIAFTNSLRELFVNLPGESWARFDMGRDAIYQYGVSIWGNNLTNPDGSSSSPIIDCTYFNLPVYMGIIPAFIYLGMYILLVRKCIYLKNFRLFLIQCVVLLYGISENIFNYPCFMFLFLINDENLSFLLEESKVCSYS